MQEALEPAQERKKVRVSRSWATWLMVKETAPELPGLRTVGSVPLAGVTVTDPVPGPGVGLGASATRRVPARSRGTGRRPDRVRAGRGNRMVVSGRGPESYKAIGVPEEGPHLTCCEGVSCGEGPGLPEPRIRATVARQSRDKAPEERVERSEEREVFLKEGCQDRHSGECRNPFVPSQILHEACLAPLNRRG